MMQSKLFSAVLGVVCLPLLGAAEPSGSGVPRRPNVIVIFTDDQTFRGIGYENPEVKTPRLDALAASGQIFERAYVASPICAASRAAMMTGRFPQQNGVVGLGHSSFKQYLAGQPSEQQTLACRLSAAGYRTGFFGKSHLGRPAQYGFQAGREIGKDDEIFSQAAAFLKERTESKEPFFLWLAPHQPHLPLLPEQKWLDLYSEGAIHLPGNFRSEPTDESLNNQGVPGKTLYRDSKSRTGVERLPAGPPRDEKTMLAFIRLYYAVISHLDEQVGQLADLLRETGLLENTIVFYLSDNGYHLGSHGLGNKITMHEESVRVPLFAFGAGVQPGRKTRALVSSLDLYPTILELAGASAPPQPVAGKSLLPLLGDSSGEVRKTVFSECVGVSGTAGQGHRMARGDRWKLILSDADEEFFFDQEADPLESRNRRNDPELAAVLGDLRSELSAWMKASGDRAYPRPIR
jgi:arylsulfatase A-like enzyme